MNIVECRDCGETYDETQNLCPKCGSPHKIISISCEDISFVLSASVEGMKGKNPHLPSKRKLRWEWTDKDTVQRGDGVTRIHFYRSMDKDSDEYEEVITDLETGQIIHECKEPLSKHTGHGSAKVKSEIGDK